MEKKTLIYNMSKESEAIKRELGQEPADIIVSSIYKEAEKILAKSSQEKSEKINISERIDDLVTSKYFAFPLMLVLLGLIFWISLVGAEYPTSFLLKTFFNWQVYVTRFFNFLKVPLGLHNIMVLGVYRTLAWVIAVMFPPMAIFFPLFTFLEDLGYLPRVAFNMDRIFKLAGAHGKQSLTMAMGFGCNAAGVMACRIIDSPREKLIAILTNTFMPCNGRFPLFFAMAIILASSFRGYGHNPLYPPLVVVGMVLIGLITTFLVSYLLSHTILKGKPSSFTLELPPYRRPHLGHILVRSFLDRTLFVLSRAIIVAAPAGAIMYILANTHFAGENLITHLALYFEPFGRFIGLDGYILLAFLIALPANEIVLPVLIMSYLSLGIMEDITSLEIIGTLFANNGWTALTIINTMLFSLLHFPCGTTLLTIKKEVGKKWALLGFLIPTLVALLVCFLTARLADLIALIT